MQPRTLFRIVSVAEAVTWTALLIAIILRATGGDVPFFFAVGLAHGVVFFAFVASTVVVGLNQRWPWWLVLVTALTSVPPYGTVVMDAVLERTGRLRGGWRRHASDDPRDARWVDRALRFFLLRPWLFVVVLVLVIALLTVVALVAGPPGR